MMDWIITNWFSLAELGLLAIIAFCSAIIASATNHAAIRLDHIRTIVGEADHRVKWAGLNDSN